MGFFSEGKVVDLEDIISEHKLKKQVLQLKISLTGHSYLLLNILKNICSMDS